MHVKTREVPGLVAEALAALPDDGRLLVFHSAVIAYLDVHGRELFAALMRDLLTDPRLHWVSNERQTRSRRQRLSTGSSEIRERESE